MANNTIGQFISVLRKANGMTQQQLADRLNVSNKAVSRWERDETAPDITLIPAIAEIFGVTCDELLKGERLDSGNISQRTEKQVEKQIHSLLSRTMMNFKTLIWIAFALSLAGLVCMLAITIVFAKSEAGFAVMLLFQIPAFVMAVMAVSRVKTAKRGNELFGYAGSNELKDFDRVFGNYSFFIFCTLFAVILISVFLLFDLNITTLYVETVMTETGLMTTGKIFRYDIFVIVLVLSAIYLYLKDIFIAWITEKPIKVNFDKTVSIMTAVQIAFVVLGCVFFIIAPYGDISVNDVSPFSIAFNILGLVCLVGNIVSFAVFAIRHKKNRKNLIFKGIRNCLFTVSGFLMTFVHEVSFTTFDEITTESTSWERCDEWSPGYLIVALLFAFSVIILFKVIERIIEKYKNKHKTYCREDVNNV